MWLSLGPEANVNYIYFSFVLFQVTCKQLFSKIWELDFSKSFLSIDKVLDPLAGYFTYGEKCFIRTEKISVHFLSYLINNKELLT